MYDISIDTNAVVTNLKDFQSKINEMDALLQEVKTELDDVKNYWQGEEGEETELKMDEFSKTFTEITNNSNSFTEFLDYAIEKYEKYENKNINKQENELAT